MLFSKTSLNVNKLYLIRRFFALFGYIGFADSVSHGIGVTESPSHRVTESPSHRVTESPSHRVTESPSHRVTESEERRKKNG
ncbi:MAG: hypothetical protein HCA25_15700 [Dolichospermum sp. DET50]|nr:hypothetical protein [Dolichospermum sp. DET50]